MPVIRIEDIAHVRFAAPDLRAMHRFLEDFGLKVFEERGRLYGKAGDGRPFVHVTEPGEANDIVCRGDADLIFVGRQLLREPYWAIRAQTEMDAEPAWPVSYGYAVRRRRSRIEGGAKHE